MRVLGIDPGSRYTGYGIVESDGGGRRSFRHVASGRINATSADSFEARLPLIYDGVVQVIDKFDPTEAALEGLFTAFNAQSTIKLGHARGVAVLAIRHADLELESYPPARVKKTVAGHGRAEKHQVAEMVKMSLEISGDLAEDAADALAVALCHCHTADFDRRVQ
jgi:crossover junction endodeoxyribonuclease RuvC